MQKVTVVIPTYWTWPKDIKDKEEKSIFEEKGYLNSGIIRFYKKLTWKIIIT